MMVRWLGLSAMIVVLDQITKTIASANLVLHVPVAVSPGFNWTLMHNYGAAFSFLGDASGWQRWFFSAVAIGVSIVIVWWLRKLSPTQQWLGIGLALVLGGALGNVWDRFAHGYVIDFIDVYYSTLHWPAFNLADAVISVGAVMLIVDSFRAKIEAD